LKCFGCRLSIPETHSVPGKSADCDLPKESFFPSPSTESRSCRAFSKIPELTAPSGATPDKSAPSRRGLPGNAMGLYRRRCGPGVAACPSKPQPGPDPPHPHHSHIQGTRGGHWLASGWSQPGQSGWLPVSFYVLSSHPPGAFTPPRSRGRVQPTTGRLSSPMRGTLPQLGFRSPQSAIRNFSGFIRTGYDHGNKALL